MSTRSLAAKVLACAVLVGSAVPTAAGADPIPGSNCQVFPDSNIWNTRVDSLPVHEMSETWLRSADAGSTDLHPDFGPPSYGLPFDVVGRRHAKVHVRFAYDDESDPGPYPFDARTPIEGGSDRHALIVQRGTCRLYELFAAAWNDGDPRAGSGAIFDLDYEPPPPRDVDLGRRRGAPDPRRARALGRGQGRQHPACDPVHRVVHDRRVRLARAPRGRRG